MAHVVVRREPRVLDRVWVDRRTEQTGRCGPERGPASGARERPTKSRRTRRLGKFGGHCRYKAGLKLLRRLMWSLRREPRVIVPVRVRVAVGPSKRAGVVPKGGRLRERGMTYWPHRSGRLGKSVGTAINILASWHPGEQKGGGSFHVQRGYEW